MAHDEFFVDTSGFFALMNSDDPMHLKAGKIVAAASAARRRWRTTEWVIGETCTLLVARRKRHLIGRFLDFVERNESMTVTHLDPSFLGRVRSFLRDHLDHDYSFTDCTSFVLMRDSGLTDALTTDRHFQEAGFQVLLT